jgi:F-type H+-transporting ATPase subunit gamma
MSSLKDLKIRIDGIKSTGKVTKAMKMVAAARLRRIQEQRGPILAYVKKMGEIVDNILNSSEIESAEFPLLSGNKNCSKHLLVVVTSDRGLCGSFNANIVKRAKEELLKLEGIGKEVKIFCIGKKGYDQLKFIMNKRIVDVLSLSSKNKALNSEAEDIAGRVVNWFESGEFGSCSFIYNRFVNTLSQIVTTRSIIPVEAENEKAVEEDEIASSYEYEPLKEKILARLLEKNISVQVLSILLENMTSEHASRMVAMDNATNNAGDMIEGLTLEFNRSRQASITKELMEVISGAEAL